jgi:hypothetical protein
VSEMHINTTLQMHAHRCQKCAAAGKDVIWIHPDICRGKVAAHTCPECGTVEWKQCVVETGKLPRVAQEQVQNVQRGNEVLAYVVIAIGVAALAYVGFIYFKEWRKGKTIV